MIKMKHIVKIITLCIFFSLLSIFVFSAENKKEWVNPTVEEIRTIQKSDLEGVFSGMSDPQIKSVLDKYGHALSVTKTGEILLQAGKNTENARVGLRYFKAITPTPAYAPDIESAFSKAGVHIRPHSISGKGTLVVTVGDVSYEIRNGWYSAEGPNKFSFTKLDGTPELYREGTTFTTDHGSIAESCAKGSATTCIQSSNDALTIEEGINSAPYEVRWGETSVSGGIDYLKAQRPNQAQAWGSVEIQYPGGEKVVITPETDQKATIHFKGVAKGSWRDNALGQGDRSGK